MVAYKVLNEDSMWQDLVWDKYLQFKMLLQLKAKPRDPAFSKGFMRAE
jgi:hypothetical protein